MSFDEVLGFHQEVVSGFERAGYALVSVPRGSIEDRAAFVRALIRDAGSGA